ncbi:MAG TPA: hypothetical protein VI603_01245 [Saprospiraceae bacterium]|nr:hypothetical protein [Saprospiraceae bacterium]
MPALHSANRTISLALAFLVFFSSSAFAIDVHYCQDRIKSFSVFGKAKGCNQMDPAVLSCAHMRTANDASDHGSVDKKQCCQDKLFYIQSDYDVLIQSFDNISFSRLQSYIPSYFSAILSPCLIDTHTPAFFRYKPPLILRDIPVLLGTFLL